jgi:putative membrane protein (TIGR04086 family)
VDNEKSPIFRISENPVFFGLTAAILFAILSIMVLALSFHLSALSELYLKPAGTFFYLVGSFLGGFLAAKKAGGKGLVYGAGVGLCYYIFFVVISLFFSPGSLSVIALGFKGLYTLLVSAAGGICGLAFA